MFSSRRRRGGRTLRMKSSSWREVVRCECGLLQVLRNRAQHANDRSSEAERATRLASKTTCGAIFSNFSRSSSCSSRAITSPAYAQWSALRRASPPAQRDYLVSQAVVLSLRDAVLALLLLFLCGDSSAYMQLAFPSAEVWKQSISIDRRHCRTFCGPD